MNRFALLLASFGLLAFVGDVRGQGTPAEQYKALAKEWNEAARDLWVKSQAGESTDPVAERVVKLLPRFLELVEKNPRDPIALDCLVLILTQEIWLENNTKFSARKQDSAQEKAIAILLRDHVESDKISEACRRMTYGFSKECETALRTILAKNPHKDIQAQACYYLAHYLHGRLQRLDLLKGNPDMVRRFEALFGKEYLESIQRRDRAAALKEVEAIFERADKEFGDRKLPYIGTVGERSRIALFEMRHLSVGKEAADIEGVDQDSQRFKLSDYRGKVVLLYFWSDF
jgi:hypothetical protein